ncbi:hypothetical protein STEG23_011994 [Scotinomys teguina]
MKTAAGSGEVNVNERPKLGLCVLCGLPAAGKSTFARALALRLRQERDWAVGVLSYDDVLPAALPDRADTQLRVSTERVGRADCPLETCLLRNGQRPQSLPNETIHLMEKKIEKPNPEKNAWERNSLIIQSSACSLEASLEVTDLLLTALENPIKCVEDNAEQKETDRVICSTNILHKADETLRRTISQTMKEAKDEQIPLNNLKRLAEELNKLRADVLEGLRRGNGKHLCFQQTTDVISSFCDERDTIVQKYFSKQH